MSWQQSVKRTYQSRYSESFVTVSQYITEYMCELVAKQSGQELPQKFWKDEQWEKFFKYQVVIANGLLKKYHPRAIVRTLRRPELNRLTSLMGLVKIPRFERVLKQEHARAETEDKAPVTETKRSTVTEVRKVPKGNNKLGKLREL